MRSNSVSFIFASVLLGSTLKGKNLLPRSKFFPVRLDPFSEGFIPQEKKQEFKKKKNGFPS